MKRSDAARAIAEDEIVALDGESFTQPATANFIGGQPGVNRAGEIVPTALLLTFLCRRW